MRYPGKPALEQKRPTKLVLLFHNALMTLGLGLWEAIGARYTFLGGVAIVLTALVLTTKIQTSIGQDWLGEEGLGAGRGRLRCSRMEEQAP